MDEAVDPVLPHAVALAWGVAELPQRGPKREMSIERIVDAAIELADAEGLAAVSMARVAAALGYTTMSLYRYVTSKDDLLLLMQEEASGVPIPPEREDQDWRDGLREWAATTLEVYRAHPWFADIPVRGAPMTPNNLSLADWGLRIMRNLPLDDGEKISVILLVSGHIRSFGIIERDLRRAASDGLGGESAAGSAAALRELVTESRFPYLYPLVQSGVYTDDGDNSDEGDVSDDFTFGLERILDGIQVRVEQLGGMRATPAAEAARPAYPRDKAVKDAVRARREAEAKLREARGREKEAMARAREREREAAAKERDRAAKAAARAAR